MEVLSSSKPVPGFQGGTVRHTKVTKMEKIRLGFGHYSSYTFHPIWVSTESKLAQAVYKLEMGLYKIYVYKFQLVLQRVHTNSKYFFYFLNSSEHIIYGVFSSICKQEDKVNNYHNLKPQNGNTQKW